MGAFQRLPKGRPWGGFRSPWRCWACRPCWALWWTPSTTSTTATLPRSCRSSLRIRRQAWWWKRWFTMGQTATAGFLRRFFHHLPLRHRLTREPQQQQQQPPPQQPQLRIQQQNIHHRPPPPHLHLLLHPHPLLLRPHPQRQRQPRQQQRQQGTQRAQEEGQRRLGPQGPEEQALQTMSEPPPSSGRRRRQDRLQYSWTLQTLPTFLLLDPLPKLKTSPMSRTEAQNLS